MLRVVSILTFFIFCIACTSSKIYIVRHAEKGKDPADNPHLSELGVARANDLANMLQGKHIAQIYSTELNRTIETAKPLSDKINVPIKYYRNDSLLQNLVRIVQSEKNTLIVGHSNTVLKMLDALQVAHPHVKEIPDNKYDYMFILRIKAKNPVGYSYHLREITYGKPSPAPGDSSGAATMK
ncbi:MAG: histidine phosphatase family protein [Bacteroidetes bacterium]|nr:MAG: histidine phosphatase family protein [Bacteroidota bacterium]